MRLTINLATRRYLNLRLLNAVLLACFVLLGALAVFAVGKIAQNAGELSRIQRLSGGIGSGTGGAQVSEAQLKGLGARIRFANAAIEKKSVNWLILLDLLEEVVPSGVALTQIEPPAKREQTLKITGVARDFANLRIFLENLESSKTFSEVYLLSQTETKVGLTQRGLSFNITCKVALR